MKNNYKWFLILIGADIFFSALLFLIFGHPDVSPKNEPLIIPFTFILNIVLALILGLLKFFGLWNNNIYQMFLLNAVVACLVVLLVDFSWDYYEQISNDKTMTFNVDNQTYKLELTYKDTSYDIEKISGEKDQLIISGKYEIENGKIYLNSTMTIYQDSLSGFEGEQKLRLNEK